MRRPGTIRPFARDEVETDKVARVGLSERVGQWPTFPGPATVLRAASSAGEVVSSASKMSAFPTRVPERPAGELLTPPVLRRQVTTGGEPFKALRAFIREVREGG